jgi:hypothetical protein
MPALPREMVERESRQEMVDMEDMVVLFIVVGKMQKCVVNSMSVTSTIH